MTVSDPSLNAFKSSPRESNDSIAAGAVIPSPTSLSHATCDEGETARRRVDIQTGEAGAAANQGRPFSWWERLQIDEENSHYESPGAGYYSYHGTTDAELSFASLSPSVRSDCGSDDNEALTNKSITSATSPAREGAGAVAEVRRLRVFLGNLSTEVSDSRRSAGESGGGARYLGEMNVTNDQETDSISGSEIHASLYNIRNIRAHDKKGLPAPPPANRYIVARDCCAAAENTISSYLCVCTC